MWFISGNTTDPGWEKNHDGEKVTGLQFKADLDGSGALKLWSIVKPDPFSAAAASCKLRPNWRLAICDAKYGNVMLFSSFNWFARSESVAHLINAFVLFILILVLQLGKGINMITIGIK